MSHRRQLLRLDGPAGSLPRSSLALRAGRGVGRSAPSGRSEGPGSASFATRAGETTALRAGPVPGRTTLLNLVGGDRPECGRIRVGGLDLAGLGEGGLLRLGRERIGFVFQSFGLLPVLGAAENAGVPLRLRRMPPPRREAPFRELPALGGPADHAEQRAETCAAVAPWLTRAGGGRPG